METYIDVYIYADGEKASNIYKKIMNIGIKPAIGKHDFVKEWEGIISIGEVANFADEVQSELKGTGAYLKFTSSR